MPLVIVVVIVVHIRFLVVFLIQFGVLFFGITDHPTILGFLLPFQQLGFTTLAVVASGRP